MVAGNILLNLRETTFLYVSRRTLSVCLSPGAEKNGGGRDRQSLYIASCRMLPRAAAAGAAASLSADEGNSILDCISPITAGHPPGAGRDIGAPAANRTHHGSCDGHLGDSGSETVQNIIRVNR